MSDLIGRMEHMIDVLDSRLQAARSFQTSVDAMTAGTQEILYGLAQVERSATTASHKAVAVSQGSQAVEDAAGAIGERIEVFLEKVAAVEGGTVRDGAGCFFRRDARRPHAAACRLDERMPQRRVASLPIVRGKGDIAMRKIVVISAFSLAMLAAPGAALAVKRSTVVGVGAGAVAGGVVAGPVGAVVGGAAGGYVGSRNPSGHRARHVRHRR